MDDRRPREEADTPTAIPDAIAPFEVLAVHEKPLVEATCGLEHRAWQQHERTRDPVDVALFGMIPVARQQHVGGRAVDVSLYRPSASNSARRVLGNRYAVCCSRPSG